MTKKIGLFGGTFDPVHKGHVSIAHSFLQSKIIDELWILLTPFPPHKNGEIHASYKFRYEMLASAFSDVKESRILTIENELSKPSYSFNTIRYLKERNPDFDFFFCIGEDNLAKFHTWKHHKEILDEANLLVAKRPGINHSNVSTYILEQTTFVDHTPIEVSSSLVKDLIDDKEELRKIIPEKVLDIILREELYKTKIN